jgi:NADPH-dependent ferric siderophore reductase
MARITLTAPAFADFGVTEPGEIVTLGWAPDGEELVLPQLGWRFPRGTREQHWRNYTVRRHDPAGGEIDVDFALHEDPGIATRWAAGAKPGDRAGFAGPRTHWEADGGADWSLLVAVDTGVPAALAILESLPAGHRAIALLEVADDREEQPVATNANADVRWLSRNRQAPGTTTLLPDTLRKLELPAGRGRVWGAGESRVMRRVRDHVRRSRGIPKEAVSVLGYWAVSRSSNGTSSPSA